MQHPENLLRKRAYAPSSSTLPAWTGIWNKHFYRRTTIMPMPSSGTSPCVLVTGAGRELMQETFPACMGAHLKGKKVDNLRAFLYRVANNLIVDLVRRKKLRKKNRLRTSASRRVSIPRRRKTTAPQCASIPKRFLPSSMQWKNHCAPSSCCGMWMASSPREIAELLKVSPNVVSVRIHRGMENPVPDCFQ